jgi:stress-induced morphogen
VVASESPKTFDGPGIKEEFAVLLRGRVPAGFDLENTPPGSFWVSRDRTSVQLTLPSPVIFEDNVSIDFENSRVLSHSDRCPDLICPATDVEQLLNEALPDGKDRIIEAARRNGILDHAAEAGKDHYQIHLESLGFEEVRVVVRGYGD